MVKVHGGSKCLVDKACIGCRKDEGMDVKVDSRNFVHSFFDGFGMDGFHDRRSCNRNTIKDKRVGYANQRIIGI